MSTEELAELFLTYVYDLSEAAPHPNFLFSVNEFAPMMGITDLGEIHKAIELLESRGFVFLASYDSWGGISAAITMDGSAFVEKGGETGLIQRYRDDPQSFIKKIPEPAAPEYVPEPERLSPRPVMEERQGGFFADRAVQAILADIEEILERDDSVGAEVKKDVFADLATLRIQMARNAKNQAVIEAMLENVSGIASIAPLVTGLQCILQAYFK